MLLAHALSPSSSLSTTLLHIRGTLISDEHHGVISIDHPDGDVLNMEWKVMVEQNSITNCSTGETQDVRTFTQQSAHHTAASTCCKHTHIGCCVTVLCSAAFLPASIVCLVEQLAEHE